MPIWKYKVGTITYEVDGRTKKDVAEKLKNRHGVKGVKLKKIVKAGIN